MASVVSSLLVVVQPDTDVLVRLNGRIPSGDVGGVVAVLDDLMRRLEDPSDRFVEAVDSYELPSGRARKKLLFRGANG